jgi:hypothetical protein
MVVATSRTEHSTINPATARAPNERPRSTLNSGSRIRRWSLTSATPGAPMNELAITSNLVGSDSWTRRLSGICSGLTSLKLGLSGYCALARS